jgi:hypothetical protein
MGPELRRILQEKGREFINAYREKLPEYIITVLLAVLSCCTFKNGYQSYFCQECKKVKRIPFSCKKRICPLCNKKANRKFALDFVQRMLPVTHRHVVFTIPACLWAIFHGNRQRLKLLITAVNVTVTQAMSMYLLVKVEPGIMCVLHGFGRDLKKNCHVHSLVTEGGMTRNGWLPFTYFPFEKKGKILVIINEIWRDNVLNILQQTLPETEGNRKFIAAIKRHYPNGFYVNGPNKNRIKTTRSARSKAKYITRYVRHLPISDSRIESYDGEIVKFWYHHPSTQKKMTVTLPVMEFIYRIVIHTPLNGFNVVVKFGLYSPKKLNKPSIQVVFSPNGELKAPKDLGWREREIMNTGRDPLCCPHCKKEMQRICIVCKRKDGFKIYYRHYDDDLRAMGYPNEGDFVEGIT